MTNSFSFKQFSIQQEHSALKLGTDAVLLGALAQFESPQHILDIGTGTGILALMQAQLHHCPIFAIDIDTNAIIDAQINAQNSPWADRIFVQKIDIQTFTKQTHNTFDGIICNPPFFSNSITCNNKSKTIARHTVTLSPETLFLCISKLLTTNGIASIIIPSSERITFCEQASKFGLYLICEVQIFPFETSQNHNRIILTFAKEWREFSSQKIHIRNEQRVYTQEFTELTKDFYLFT